jgi:hypothetical protein
VSRRPEPQGLDWRRKGCGFTVYFFSECKRRRHTVRLLQEWRMMYGLDFNPCTNALYPPPPPLFQTPPLPPHALTPLPPLLPPPMLSPPCPLAATPPTTTAACTSSTAARPSPRYTTPNFTTVILLYSYRTRFRHTPSVPRSTV